jgi:succinate dehydrogenase flavin-adding protein (antitoxin of CptAB toxin-antitoxin module)
MLRQLWSLIETTQTNLLLKQDDASLVQWILKQFKQKRSLDTQEADIISDYIYSRISLIRDLAAER